MKNDPLNMGIGMAMAIFTQLPRLPMSPGRWNRNRMALDYVQPSIDIGSQLERNGVKIDRS